MRVEQPGFIYQLSWVLSAVILFVSSYYYIYTLFIYLENLFDLVLVWAEPPLEKNS